MISLSTDSREAGFMIDFILKCVTSELVHFQFGFKASDVQVEFISLFCSFSLFTIMIVDKFSLYILFVS